MIDWLNDNSGAVQAASAMVLALTLIAVVYYAYQTREQAQATERMAEATLRPLIVLWTEDSGCPVPGRPEWYLDLTYHNLGTGPAVNINFYMHPEDGKWQQTPKRVGMGIREQKASLRVLMSPPLPAGGLEARAEYEDVSRTRWRTILQLVQDGNRFSNGECTAQKIEGQKE